MPKTAKTSDEEKALPKEVRDEKRSTVLVVEESVQNICSEINSIGRLVRLHVCFIDEMPFKVALAFARCGPVIL